MKSPSTPQYNHSILIRFTLGWRLTVGDKFKIIYPTLIGFMLVLDWQIISLTNGNV